LRQEHRRRSCKQNKFPSLISPPGGQDNVTSESSMLEYQRQRNMQDFGSKSSVNMRKAIFLAADVDNLKVSECATVQRSRSADGYHAQEQREIRKDTQVLLFDSNPDLSQDDVHFSRFPSIRSQRRGAVCYDPGDQYVTLICNTTNM
jgi:hypothetical protein